MPDLPDSPDQSVTPPDPSVIAAQQPSPIPALDTPAPPVPTEGRPSVWKGILAGALAGMAASKGSTSLGAGLASGAGGALAQQEQQKADALRAQQSQSDIRFKDAQSAHLVAQAHADGARLEALPQELRDEANMRALNLVKGYEDLGINPTLVAETTNDGSIQGLTQLTKRDGAVGNNAYINIGSHVYAFDLNQMASKPQGLVIVNQDRTLNSLDPIDAATFRSLGKQAQTKMLLDAVNHQTEVPGNGQEAAAMYQQAKNQFATYATRNDADPQILNQLKTKVNSLKAAQDYFDNRTVSLANRTAEAKQEAKPEKPVSQKLDTIVFDPDAPGLNGSKGANVLMSGAQAQAKGLVGYKGDGNKVNALVAGVNDVQTKLNQLADATSEMNEVDPGISAALSGDGVQLSYHGVGIGSVSDVLNAKGRSAAMTGMNDATRKYLIALAAAHEAVTQLPRLQTMGQSSRVTEKQMEAAVRMLPVPGDDAEMAQSKMSSLQQLIDPVRKQIPQMPGASLTPSFTENPTSRFNQDKKVGTKPPAAQSASPNPEAYLLGPNQ
jgi:hypothetical protein